MKTKAVRTIDDLTPDPENARDHPARNLALIADALREVGAARSIVIDEDGVVLAGNGVLAAARAAGLSKVRVVDADGTRVVAVRRKGLSEAEKQRLALYDNRAAELSVWKAPMLQKLAALGLTKGIFQRDDLAAITRGLAAVLYCCPRCRHRWAGDPKPPREDAK